VAIAGLEVVCLRDSEGKQIGTLKKIKLADKLSALDKLGKYGFFSDRAKSLAARRIPCSFSSNKSGQFAQARAAARCQ
jgi:hypothetical protein